MDGRDLIKRLRATRLSFFLVLTWTSSLLWGQTQDYPVNLDVLLQQRQYIELEHSLLSTASGLPPLSRAYFQGVLANRINHVQKSFLLLEPLIPSLLVINPLRAEIALCTL